MMTICNTTNLMRIRDPLSRMEGLLILGKTLLLVLPMLTHRWEHQAFTVMSSSDDPVPGHVDP